MNLSRSCLSSLNDDFWVFGYGSLMWNPGFPYLESTVAKVHGYHRCFCLRSSNYRGTVEVPGLVLGLDRGGSCHGVAFKVSLSDADEVLDYLFDREMLRDSYHPRWVNANCSHLTRPALSFVINRLGLDYAPRLSYDEQSETIARARGNRGSNFDYLENTIQQLQNLAIPDRRLQQLFDQVRHQRREK